MIGASDSGLAARAEAPTVDRMFRIPLELDRTTLSRADMETAARRALGAGRSVEHSVARSDLLRLHHVGNQFLDVVRATGGRRRAGAHSHELQKITSIELRHREPGPP